MRPTIRSIGWSLLFRGTSKTHDNNGAPAYLACDASRPDIGSVLRDARKEPGTSAARSPRSATDITVRVSRPRGFHPKPLAEPCVNLSIYTAPVIQPWPHETASVRTAAAVLPSSFATTPHRVACGVAASCICAEPSAQAFGLDTDRARAWLIDRKRRSSSTTLVSWDCIAWLLQQVALTFRP